MKCPRCGNPYVVDAKGQLSCPVCSNVKRKLVVAKIAYNDFVAFKTLKAINIIADEYILPAELKSLINEGVSVEVK